MDEKTYVYVDSDGPPELVGDYGLCAKRARKRHVRIPKDLARKSEALFPGAGTHARARTIPTDEGKALFGAIGDSAPIRWGRVLMRRAERRLAELEHRAPQTLERDRLSPDG